MTKKLLIGGVFSVAMLMNAACAESDQPADNKAEVTQAPQAESIEGPKSMTPQGKIEALDENRTGIAELARETLAEHLNVPMHTIEVDTVRAVQWSDSSTGCPQPGEAYLQVITPGHKISLRVDGKLYFVHEANGRAFVCKRTKSVGGVTNKLELVWGPAAIEAREDLAGRLGVDSSLVMVASAQGTTFSDTSLACPEPGVEYKVGNIEGWVLTLRYGSRNYTYHTDLDRVIPCPPITEE